jgi:hypothetical protein
MRVVSTSLTDCHFHLLLDCYFCQVGGWRVDYQNLTFATVRNAGHMVPYVQPERAYHLLGRFLFEDKPQPSAAAVRRQQQQQQ